MSLKKSKVWIPKEIKQKEIVWAHFLGHPITSRHLAFLGAGVLMGTIIFLFSLRIFPINELNFRDKMESLIIRVAMFLFITFVSLIFSFPDKNGKYKEEMLFTSIRYKRRSGIILNKKALQGLNNYGKVGEEDDV